MSKQNLVSGTGVNTNTQQDRKGVVEHDRRRVVPTGETRTSRTSYIFPIGDHVGMFLSGAFAASAVYFFNDPEDVYLVAAILCSVLWIRFSVYCRQRCDTPKGRYLK